MTYAVDVDGHRPLVMVNAVTACDAFSSAVLVHGPGSGAVYELDQEGNVLGMTTAEQEEERLEA